MRIVAVSALLSTIALPVMAQRAVAPVRDSAPPAAACDSVLRAAAVDSLQTVVTAYLARTDGGLVPREYADLLLQDFGQRFRVPQPLRVPVLAPGPASLRALAPNRRSAVSPRELRITGMYELTAASDGSGAEVRVRLTSMSVSFDSAVVATLEAMARDHSMPMLPDVESDDSIPLRLSITSGPPEPGRARPLFRTTLPRYAATDAAEAPGNPKPAYPAVERALGMDGYVLLQLVVGGDGRVEPGTVEVLQATSAPFLRSAVPLLGKLRFTPARVGSCPVPQVMQLPLRFVASDSGPPPVAH